MPINPIVHIHLEYLEYLVLMTNSSLLAIRGGDRRPMATIKVPLSGGQRMESWQIMATLRRIAGAAALWLMFSARRA
jgi:hypothetical protein